MEQNTEKLKEFKLQLKEYYKHIASMGGIARAKKYTSHEISEMAIKGLENKKAKGDNFKKKGK